jgi:hypothetical protein
LKRDETEPHGDARRARTSKRVRHHFSRQHAGLEAG